MATTATDTSKTDLLVTLGHRVITTVQEARASLTDGMLVVTVTPTSEHPYFVRRYDDEILVKDASSHWMHLNPQWHLPLVVVYQPTSTLS